MHITKDAIKYDYHNNMHYKIPHSRLVGYNSYPKVIYLEDEEYFLDTFIKGSNREFIETNLITNIKYKNKVGRELILDL